MNSQYQQAGPSTVYHPPLAPQIPLSAINTLIPRLTTTINDIDSLKALIAAGNADGSLPSWDTLIQRYSLLLGRVNALTTYLSPPSAQQSTGASRPSHPGQGNALVPAPGVTSASTATAPPPPPLSGYLVHPLNPLPGPGQSHAETVSPLAADAFFQAINTIPLPQLAEGSRGAEAGGGQGWHTADALRAMPEREVEVIRRSLRARLEREGMKVGAIRDEIARREDEVDWAMRIGEEDEDEEDDEQGSGQPDHDGGQGQGQEAKEDHSAIQVDDDDDDDLFGGDDDDGEDEDKAVPIDVDEDRSPTGPGVVAPRKGDEPAEGLRSPVDSWKVEDYIRFMDGGQMPAPSGT
ncbi:hypothetical protein IAU60_005721 [Kwoniella sp. DSM 27419]